MIEIPDTYSKQQQILVYLNTFDFLRSDQVQRIMGFRSVSWTWDLLNPMVEKKFIYKIPLIGTRGGKTYIYAPDKRGTDLLLADRWNVPPRTKKTQLLDPMLYSSQWYAHVTGVNDVFISFIEWSRRTPGIVLIRMLTEVGIHRDRRFHQAGLEPDGVLEYMHNDKHRFFYIEFDRTKKKEKWIAKMRKYPDFLDEHHERITGVDHAWVLNFAVGGNDHAEELMKWTHIAFREMGLTEDYMKLFLMTGSPPKKAEENIIFDEPVWDYPGGYAHLKLFEG
jgi:hypothetical protein